ncbi:hypothetical protein [Allostreptomyces psammosilenae]|uniref:Tail assembly chaperone n=1 Tax=Allostreptomyces psammosilenae TaxID=1892865 RepID=A0A852ZXV2_9ACTN|nr:hypothetical protein [Allostreptomyces psammosilenae]NYI06070.1 hypothetical protein [Allostreptomyces psammosilenae]
MPTKNDATGQPYLVEYNGYSYEVPPSEEWDIDVLEAFDDNKITVALKALLGDEQYATFRQHNRKVKALNEFFMRATEAVGAGNS